MRDSLQTTDGISSKVVLNDFAWSVYAGSSFHLNIASKMPLSFTSKLEQKVTLFLSLSLFKSILAQPFNFNSAVFQILKPLLVIVLSQTTLRNTYTLRLSLRLSLSHILDDNNDKTRLDLGTQSTSCSFAAVFT